MALDTIINKCAINLISEINFCLSDSSGALITSCWHFIYSLHKNTRFDTRTFQSIDVRHSQTCFTWSSQRRSIQRNAKSRHTIWQHLHIISESFIPPPKNLLTTHSQMEWICFFFLEETIILIHTRFEARFSWHWNDF